ncbi:hypothetical protein CANARDRAFT_28316 [[Candida] arabinofermentans NRRL YB-2248]|uniref:Serine/threonine-protein kinase RIO2 n=1 Tax=[Candida] arabinofermentans NRRL YB-2248 TaxID=983967 RepID=A0A1E4T1B4_9ASCO|nr:hypothetical protein CANARDRAFT_28316 [[Candida] arabinofermentans NRRL YB-2248]
MKLDTTHMRYLTPEDWRVLQAVEIGSRNHEIVPTKMIGQIATLKSGMGSANKAISDLAKLNLITKVRNAKYDGYRLTYNGFDYLALKTMYQKNSLDILGTTIGVGKESDIYSAVNPSGVSRVLKIHRLGRVSFRTVKTKRDYLRNNQSGNWMYLSRLAAEKEYEFMSILHRHGFNVPTPYDYSRHCILMQRIDGFPMRQLREHFAYKTLYSQLMKFAVKLANHGLIHCDYNEYNIMIKEDGSYDFKTEEGFVVIDFPQCISLEHTEAEFYFKRDIDCIRRFFLRKFNYQPKSDPTMLDTDGYGDGFKYAYPVLKRDVERIASLDVEVKASGYSKKLTGVDSDLESAVAGMRGADLGSEDDDEDSETDGGEDEDDYDEDDESLSVDEEDYESDVDDENEKIIDALSTGVGKLKMDKLGNYILDTDGDDDEEQEKS